jgi:thiol-disulfide isomerase/thioredoxin
MAIQHAANLAVIAKQVNIFLPQANFNVRNVQKMRETIGKPNVHVLYNAHVQEIGGDGTQVTYLEVVSDKAKKAKKYKVDGVFLATGSKPNSQLFKDKVAIDGDGYIILSKGQQTSLEGVYAAGDVHNRQHKQTITAAAAGCNAALQIKDFLSDLGYDAKKYELNQTDAHSVHETLAKDDDHAVHQSGGQNEVTEITKMHHLKKMISKKEEQPIILDFYLPECSNCQGMFPIFKELSQKEEFKEIKFVKVNIDKFDSDGITKKLGTKDLKTLPTFLFIHKGKEQGRFVGPCDKKRLQREINKFFKLGA